MASIYLTLKSFAVDCNKLYTRSDNNHVALSNRIASVALRGIGALVMLSGAIDVCFLNKRANAHVFSALSGLTYGLFTTIIGHEIFAIGSSISEKADLLNNEASVKNAAVAAKYFWNYLITSPQGEQQANLTAEIKHLLKYTWELKDIYADHSVAINNFFSRATKPQ